MSSIPSVPLSAMSAAQTRLDTGAFNVANTETPGFRRQEVVQTAQLNGGVSTSLTRASEVGAATETDLVAQLQAKNAFLMNLSVFKTSNDMAGSLLNVIA